MCAAAKHLSRDIDSVGPRGSAPVASAKPPAMCPSSATQGRLRLLPGAMLFCIPAKHDSARSPQGSAVPIGGPIDAAARHAPRHSQPVEPLHPFLAGPWVHGLASGDPALLAPRCVALGAGQRTPCLELRWNAGPDPAHPTRHPRARCQSTPCRRLPPRQRRPAPATRRLRARATSPNELPASTCKQFCICPFRKHRRSSNTAGIDAEVSHAFLAIDVGLLRKPRVTPRQRERSVEDSVSQEQRSKPTSQASGVANHSVPRGASVAAHCWRASQQGKSLVNPWALAARCRPAVPVSCRTSMPAFGNLCAYVFVCLYPLICLPLCLSVSMSCPSVFATLCLCLSVRSVVCKRGCCETGAGLS